MSSFINHLLNIELVSQNSVENIEKLLKAKNAYIAGCLDMWAAMLETDPEITETVIKNMDDLAVLLKKNAGVVIDNAD